MPRMTVTLPDSLTKTLQNLADMDTVAPKMLNAASPYLRDSISRRVSAHDGPGHISQHVTAQKAKYSKKSGTWSAQTKFTGYDPNHKPTSNYPNGTPYAVEAAVLEYGSVSRGIDGQPFITSAAKDAESDCVNAMQEVINEVVK